MVVSGVETHHRHSAVLTWSRRTIHREPIKTRLNANPSPVFAAIVQPLSCLDSPKSLPQNSSPNFISQRTIFIFPLLLPPLHSLYL